MRRQPTAGALCVAFLLLMTIVTTANANGVIENVTFEETALGDVPDGWLTPLYPADARWTPAFVTDDEAFSGEKSLALSGDKYSDMYRDWVWPKNGTYVFQAWFYPTIQTSSSPNPRLMFGASNSFDFSLRTNDTFISSPGPDMAGLPVLWSPNEWILLRVVIDFDANLADFYVGRTDEELQFPVIGGYSFDPAWFEIIATGSGYNLNSRVYVDDVLFRQGLDGDGDGIADDDDACPESILGETVVIDGCDSDVENHRFDDGCTMMDRVDECAADASNHGRFVRCVAHLTNQWNKDGIITGRQRGKIQSCAAQADIP